MTDEAPVRYRTNALWVLLTLLLLFGTVSGAFVVYGASSFLTTGRWFPFVPEAVAGGFVAAFDFLLLVGVLYRVDRARGVPVREVKLFD